MSEAEQDPKPSDNELSIRHDRRLANRRGWLRPGESERYLESLPDVASKVGESPEDEDSP